MEKKPQTQPSSNYANNAEERGNLYEGKNRTQSRDGRELCSWGEYSFIKHIYQR